MSAEPAPSARSRRSWVIGAAVVAVVVVAGAGALWFLGGSEPAAVDLRSADEDPVDGEGVAAADDVAQDDDPDGGGTADEGVGADAEEAVGETGEGSAVPPDAAFSDGSWSVDTAAAEFDRESGSGSFVGYRVDEELSSIGATTAVGRTPEVEGTVLLESGTVTATDIEADLTALTSDDGRRDGRVRSTFSPDATATFTLTDTIAVPELADGEVVDATATGELTIEGVTNPVEVDLQVVRRGGNVVVAGSTVITLADFGVDAPSAPIVLSVSDDAVIEWQLYLSPA